MATFISDTRNLTAGVWCIVLMGKSVYMQNGALITDLKCDILKHWPLTKYLMWKLHGYQPLSLALKHEKLKCQYYVRLLSVVNCSIPLSHWNCFRCGHNIYVIIMYVLLQKDVWIEWHLLIASALYITHFCMKNSCTLQLYFISWYSVML